jgi:ubiquinone/menaquinone biosynthesis C-methylase UbiE/uncharacterized protein YbaR (Trm112 family)
MRREILNIMSCPECGCDLTLSERHVDNGEVIDGNLDCEICGHSFTLSGGVPRMIVDLADRKDLAESWGFEWAKMAEGKLETSTYYGETEEEEIASFFNYMGISPEDLGGKVVLDAGCGCGRLTRALGQYAQEVYGVDIASSIECIHEYCKEAPNVNILQADIMNLPFKESSFDFVFCKLAVCYCTQPEQAFNKLSKLVKPGGRLFVSTPDKADLAFVVRLKDLLRITHRIPRDLLLYLSWGFAPLLSLAKIISRSPAVSLRANAFFLFNALHPSFMTRHTLKEVESWFEQEGFREIMPVTNGMPPLKSSTMSEWGLLSSGAAFRPWVS